MTFTLTSYPTYSKKTKPMTSSMMSRPTQRPVTQLNAKPGFEAIWSPRIPNPLKSALRILYKKQSFRVEDIIKPREEEPPQDPFATFKFRGLWKLIFSYFCEYFQSCIIKVIVSKLHYQSCLFESCSKEFVYDYMFVEIIIKIFLHIVLFIVLLEVFLLYLRTLSI